MAEHEMAATIVGSDGDWQTRRLANVNFSVHGCVNGRRKLAPPGHIRYSLCTRTQSIDYGQAEASFMTPHKWENRRPLATLSTDKPPLEHLQMHTQEQVTFINAPICEHGDDEALSTPTQRAAHISGREHHSLLLLFCQYPVYPAVNAHVQTRKGHLHTKTHFC
jgi:hypothetical protein